MRKISTLLMLLFAFVGLANAEVTKYYKPGERLSTLTAGQKVMFYNTCFDGTQDRTGFLTDNGSGLNLAKVKPSASPLFSEKEGVWTIASASQNGSTYTVNVQGSNGYLGIGGKTNNAEAQVLLFHEWTAAASDKKAGAKSEGADGVVVENAAIDADDKVWLVTNANQSNTWNGNQASFANWSTGHPYAIYSVEEATTEDLNDALTAAKTAAVEELTPLSQLSAIYTTAASTIASINAVALANDDLETALNTINTLVANFKAEANGKNVKFASQGSEGRNGRFLGYDNANSRAAAVADGGDAAIWTIKANADGTFKLYNWVNNIYLGTPADPTPVVTDEASAPSFTFISKAENQVALVSGGKMAHVANHTNYKLIQYYDLNDGASIWDVTAVPEIVVTHEQYNAALAAQSTLPYAVQQAYGLVTDASKYYSNWKSTAEGSYEALLDNTESSYFHSAYTSEAQAAEAETHYIQADLGEGNSVDQFYFYMLPRSGNGNNRPKNITIYGSNDNSAFTEIAQVTTTLDSSMNPYMSAKIGTEGTNYRYIRLTVTSTNTSTKFFTLSELYFLPANQDVTNLVNAYKNFASSSITSAEMATAAAALINAETVLALSNIKKEVNALLTANATNHAETPALGQYATADYNALQAAYNAADATQESLETAIANFNKAKNVPVYFITSKHSGYAAGSAIYYDGAWKWKTANKYDKQMWMTIPDYNQANVPAVEAYNAEGTSYAICDYLTGTKMRGKDVQIVKVADWEGAYNLQYNADANSTDAAQHAKDTGDLVNWKPGTKDNAQASVWGIEYLGSSYELDQLTDAHIEAVSALYTSATANVKYVDAVMGSGIGQYTGNKDAFNTAIANAQTIQSKTVLEVAAMNVADITAITTALTESAATFKLNMPTAGFYRVKSMNANDAAKKGKYWQSKEDATGMELAAEKDNARSIIYLGEDNSVTSYGCGYALNQYAGMDAAGTEGKAWTIAENAAVAGAYALFANGNAYCLSDWTGSVTYGQNDANAAWAIEEVTVLPVKISAAGYATLYAPVALTLPAEGLKAYTIVVNGEWATLNVIEGSVIPAETGVVLEGAEGTYNLTVGGSAEVISGNELLGTFAASYVTEDAYVLGNINVAEEGQPEKKEVGFYTAKMKDGQWLNNGFKAYLPKTGLATTLRFNFGGTTAIESVLNNGIDANAAIYDLSGRRVEKAVKGIYIQNGKKIIVK